MATHSIIPTFKAALVAALKSGLSGVQVVYGRPQDSLVARQCVYVGDVRGNHHIPVLSSGRKVREERFTVDVAFAVAAASGTVAAAEQAVLTLAAALEDVLATDPNVSNVSGLVHATVSSWEVATGYAKEGPVSVAVIGVDVLARLS